MSSLNETITLPTKETLLCWRCVPVIEALMADYKWPHHLATQWFEDLMRWIYSSAHWKNVHRTTFSMDNMHYLDDVWHTYILHTREYMLMCDTLFRQYIHHNPESKLRPAKNNRTRQKEQMLLLLDDWGEAYIDRVWHYAADLSDYLTSVQPVIHANNT